MPRCISFFKLPLQMSHCGGRKKKKSGPPSRPSKKLCCYLRVFKVNLDQDNYSAASSSAPSPLPASPSSSSTTTTFLLFRLVSPRRSLSPPRCCFSVSMCNASFSFRASLSLLCYFPPILVAPRVPRHKWMAPSKLRFHPSATQNTLPVKAPEKVFWFSIFFFRETGKSPPPRSTRMWVLQCKKSKSLMLTDSFCSVIEVFGG